MKNLFLITGFLGAGKTTLIKNILLQMNKQVFGLIINDFASKDVDGELLSSEDVVLDSISNGSIFCSCKSNNFVEALIKMSKTDVSDVLIETSGFSDPRDMVKLMKIVNQKTQDSYDYRGMISVVSSKNIYKLINTLQVIKGQIVNSSVIILNKIDIASDEDIKKSIDSIKKYNNNAIIYNTKYAQIDVSEVLNDLRAFEDKGTFIPKTKNLNFQKHVEVFDAIVLFKNLNDYLLKNSKNVFRIKGFVRTDRGFVHVDCVQDEISINLINEVKTESFLVLLGENLKKAKIELKNLLLLHK